jgi:hypothetical protein
MDVDAPLGAQDDPFANLSKRLKLGPAASAGTKANDVVELHHEKSSLSGVVSTSTGFIHDVPHGATEFSIATASMPINPFSREGTVPIKCIIQPPRRTRISDGRTYSAPPQPEDFIVPSNHGIFSAIPRERRRLTDDGVPRTDMQLRRGDATPSFANWFRRSSTPRGGNDCPMIDYEIRFLGVSYEGLASYQDAIEFPDEWGRYGVAMFGGVTLACDLRFLEDAVVGDKIEYFPHAAPIRWSDGSPKFAPPIYRKCTASAQSVSSAFGGSGGGTTPYHGFLGKDRSATSSVADDAEWDDDDIDSSFYDYDPSILHDADLEPSPARLKVEDLDFLDLARSYREHRRQSRAARASQSVDSSLERTAQDHASIINDHIRPAIDRHLENKNRDAEYRADFLQRVFPAIDEDYDEATSLHDSTIHHFEDDNESLRDIGSSILSDSFTTGSNLAHQLVNAYNMTEGGDKERADLGECIMALAGPIFKDMSDGHRLNVDSVDNRFVASIIAARLDGYHHHVYKDHLNPKYQARVEDMVRGFNYPDSTHATPVAISNTIGINPFFTPPVNRQDPLFAASRVTSNNNQMITMMCNAYLAGQMLSTLLLDEEQISVRKPDDINYDFSGIVGDVISSFSFSPNAAKAMQGEIELRVFVKGDAESDLVDFFKDMVNVHGSGIDGWNNHFPEGSRFHLSPHYVLVNMSIMDEKVVTLFDRKSEHPDDNGQTYHRVVPNNGGAINENVLNDLARLYIVMSHSENRNNHNVSIGSYDYYDQIIRPLVSATTQLTSTLAARALSGSTRLTPDMKEKLVRSLEYAAILTPEDPRTWYDMMEETGNIPGNAGLPVYFLDHPFATVFLSPPVFKPSPEQSMNVNVVIGSPLFPYNSAAGVFNAGIEDIFELGHHDFGGGHIGSNAPFSKKLKASRSVRKQYLTASQFDISEKNVGIKYRELKKIIGPLKEKKEALETFHKLTKNSTKAEMQKFKDDFAGSIPTSDHAGAGGGHHHSDRCIGVLLEKGEACNEIKIFIQPGVGVR